MYSLELRLTLHNWITGLAIQSSSDRGGKNTSR